jgi:hypothetical protein
MTLKNLPALPFVPRYTLADMQEFARAKGGKCISNEYRGIYTPLTWKCKNGHTWDALPTIVTQGGWCVTCLKQEKKKKERLEKLNRIAEKNGGKCLSKKYVNQSTKLKWQCSKGHRWETTPKVILQGSWCRKCAQLRSKLTIEAMKKLAERKGGLCLSETYVSNVVKLTWQCNKGHVWKTTPAGVISGNWCPVCVRRAKSTIEEMRQVAQLRGGKCLSTRYVNTHSGLIWQCDKGHQWEAKPGTVKRGTWCPVCAIDIKKKNLFIKKKNKPRN